MFIEQLSLPAELVQLVKEIEYKVGNNIEIIVEDEARYKAAQEILDGKPIIKFLREIREIDVCHELLHMRLEIRGYPRSVTLSDSPPFDKVLVTNNLIEFQSMIEHQIIYPEMENYGYDPYSDCEQTVVNSMLPQLQNKQYLSGLPPHDLYCGLAQTITRVLLETKNPEIKKRVRRLVANEYVKPWKASRDIELMIRDQIGKWTPERCENVLINVMDRLGIKRSSYKLVANSF